MIVTIESTPDTVIALATGAKVVVGETPEEVAIAVRAYRTGVLAEALGRRGAKRQPASAAAHRESARLTAVEDEPLM